MRKIFKVAIGVTAVTIVAASTAIVGTAIYLSKTHQTTDDLKKKAKKTKDKVLSEISDMCDDACEKVEKAKDVVVEKAGNMKEYVHDKLNDSKECTCSADDKDCKDVEVEQDDTVKE